MYLKFDEIQIDKEEFHKSKKPVELDLIYTNKAFVSDRFELDEGDKYYLATKMVNLLDHYAVFYLK